MMLDQPSGTTEMQLPAGNGVWDLRGRRLLSWRNWDLFGAGVYDRGDGEGIWRSDQHRVIFSLTPLPVMLVQIDDGRPLNVHPTPDAVSLYPAGPMVRTAGTDSRYAQVCWNASLYQSIAPDLSRLPQLEPAVGFQDPLLGPLIRTLIEEIGQGTLDRLLAESLVAAIAMRVAQRFALATPQQPDLPRARLHRVIEYIEAHLDQDLTLTELASVACLSPCHFSRSFKQAMGSGPQRYTVQRRVERAKVLLRDDDSTLAGIAATLGFADQSHFTAAFRRETGVPPGRYRTAAV